MAAVAAEKMGQNQEMMSMCEVVAVAEGAARRRADVACTAFAPSALHSKASRRHFVADRTDNGGKTVAVDATALPERVANFDSTGTSQAHLRKQKASGHGRRKNAAEQ